jgi:ribosome-associated translation inhibitor RaiA
MATIIHSRQLQLTPESRAQLAQRFEFALRRFENDIERTEVFFKDLNSAAKGGQDQSVLVKVRLRGRPTVVVESVSHDIFIAINLAARRCKRAVRRSLKQARRVNHTRLREVPA